jgi:CubicO group peptidase (beta-lactamase class C family)
MTTRYCKLLYVGAAMLATSAPHARADAISDQVDAIFAKYDQPNSPGCAVGAIQDGKLVYARGHGFADIEHDIALDERSAMRIASITKQFTATAILLAAQQGKLSLGDDIRKYLKWFPDYGHRITIANLIHQTSGIRDYINVGFVGGERLEDTHEEPDFIATLRRQTALDFEPGTRWAYSNSNYLLLELILQAATGESLRAFGERNIFSPLGMKETFFGDRTAEVVPNAASAYGVGPDGKPRVKWTHYYAMGGDGMLVTTVRDLALWDANFYANRLGRGNELIDALRDHGRLNDGGSADYGGGLMFGLYRGLPFEFHNGAFLGFQANLMRFPQQHFSSIVLCNAENAEPSYFSRKIADIFLKSAFTSASLEELAVRPTAVTTADLLRWTGFYRNHVNAAVSTVGVRDGHLLWNEATPLIALEGTRFTTSSGREVRFSFDQGVPIMTVMDSHPSVYHHIEAATVSEADLTGYAGSYVSADVPGRFSLESGAGVLHFFGPGTWAGSTPKFPRDFKPAGPDEFYTRVATLRFQRDARHRITGFSFSAAEGPQAVLFERVTDK